MSIDRVGGSGADDVDGGGVKVAVEACCVELWVSEAVVVVGGDKGGVKILPLKSGYLPPFATSSRIALIES